MNKSELVDAVASGAGVSRGDAEGVLTTFFETVKTSTKSGDTVSWPGFGKFKTSARAARTARNPQTGQSVKVKASTAMRFAPSSVLKDFLNTKGAGKKATARTSAATKASGGRATASKATAAKATTTRSAAKATAAKSPAAKASTSRSTATKSTASNGSGTSKAPAKKAAAKKAPATKGTAAKAPAKKAPAKRSR